MKKGMRILLACAALLALVVVALSTEVKTRQGVNYELRVIKIPLYLKMLDFADRHCNYKVLTRRLTAGAKTDREKVLKMLEWTFNNIRRNPPQLPIVDDHVWHIIVRGYGVNDQFQDVFTTLCNYGGYDAFFSVVYIERPKKGRMLSFVRLDGSWRVFDAYNGVYFINGKGAIAGVNDILAGDWKAVGVSKTQIPEDYRECLVNLNMVNYDNWQNSRPAIQSPIRRFLFWLKKD